MALNNLSDTQKKQKIQIEFWEKIWKQPNEKILSDSIISLCSKERNQNKGLFSDAVAYYTWRRTENVSVETSCKQPKQKKDSTVWKKVSDC